MPESFQNKSLFAFDLDDTLINTKATYFAAIQKGLNQVSSFIPNFELEQDYLLLKTCCKEFGSSNIRNYFRAYYQIRFDLDKQDFENAFSLFLSAYEDYYWKALCSYSGVHSYLSTVKNLQKEIYLITNAELSKTQFRKLKTTGLDSFFIPQNTYVSGDYGPEAKKPFPYLFELVSHQSGIKSEDSVYFGNQLGDLLGAKIAGWSTVLFESPETEKFNIPALLQPNWQVKNWDLLK